MGNTTISFTKSILNRIKISKMQSARHYARGDEKNAIKQLEKSHQKIKNTSQNKVQCSHHDSLETVKCYVLDAEHQIRCGYVCIVCRGG